MVARNMVQRLGMGQVGMVDVTLLRSQQMQAQADAEVAALLREAYRSALDVLRRHKEQLHGLARHLLQRGTLRAREICEAVDFEAPNCEPPRQPAPRVRVIDDVAGRQPRGEK